VRVVWHGVIHGEPASKANSRMPIAGVSKAGKRYTRWVKSKKAQRYCDNWEKQAAFFTRNLAPVKCDVVVIIRIWYASRRPDLDESLILDLLEGHAYVNDRQVKEKHVYWMGVDRAEPRAEIDVSERLSAIPAGARRGLVQ